MEFAQRYKSAAELLFNSMDFDKLGADVESCHDLSQFRVGVVYNFLIGIALENVLKAIFVRKNGNSYDAIESLLKKIRTHDLCRLAQETGVADSFPDWYEGKQAYLFSLSQEIKWRSRYPVPLDMDAALPGFLPEGGFFSYGRSIGSGDWAAFIGVFDKLEKYYSEQ